MRTRSLLTWLGLSSNAVAIEDTKIVVISTHLDDAVLSVGAALSRAARHGANVTVLTVLAGDPASSAPAGSWDAQAGFRTAGEASAARRKEDTRACSILGVAPRWLPFADDQYDPTPDEQVVAALRSELDGFGLVLLPGFPLTHRDHEWLSRLVLERVQPKTRLLLYAEQPYYLRENAGPPAGWQPAAAALQDRVKKVRACRAYASQLELLGPRGLSSRLARFEAARGGELIGER
jgi:LmbE family N-acetylglucosaminyl deacetylase